MANKLYEENSIRDIANAIREKNGSSDTYTVAEMGDAVRSIESGGGVDYIEMKQNKTPYTYENENIIDIADYLFAYDCGVTSVSLPNATTINTGCFQGVRALKNLHLPKLENVKGTNHIQDALMEKITFQLVTTAPRIAFCIKLKMLDFHKVTTIGASVFQTDTVLSALIIRTETLCTLSNVNAFTNTPIAKGTGYIYVPRNLVDTYKTATNWVTCANQFRALEDYTVDGTINGALDESKI